MSTERLLQIKDQIDEGKSKKSEIIGQIKSIESQMENTYEVKTLKEAEKKLKSIGDELDKQEIEFKAGMEELEDGYEWA